MDQAWGLQNMVSAMAMRPGADVPPGHQASSLLNMAAKSHRRCRAIAIAGGKGGVGKSTTAVNLGMSLSMAGHDVILLDADMGLANVDVLLGITPSRHIGHFLEGECKLEDLLMDAPKGLKIIPAGSGARRLAQLDRGEYAGVIRAFDELSHPPRYLIVDTAAGLSDSVSMFASAADDVVLVVCDEPASITDAYALIKVLSRDFGVHRFRMVANMMRSEAEARQLHHKLTRVSDRFLDVVIEFSGWIPHDERLRQAIKRQAAVVDLWPTSRSAMAFKKLAGVVDTWAEPERTGHDRITFFGNRVTPVAGY